MVAVVSTIPPTLQLSDLAKHAHRIHEFGEAERFMFDVSHSLVRILLHQNYSLNFVVFRLLDWIAMRHGSQPWPTWETLMTC